MVKFIYTNAKNVSIDHMSFELNCYYHLHISFKNKANPYSKSYSANILAKELRDLMSVF